MSPRVYLPGGKVDDLVKIWTQLGIPENEAKRYVNYLNAVFDSADQQLVKRFVQQKKRLGTKYTEAFKNGNIRWIRDYFPRKPGGAPRKDQVNLVEKLMKEGASDYTLVETIKGKEEADDMSELDLKRTATEIRKPVVERKRRTRARRKRTK